jgi:hypothetical protein
VQLIVRILVRVLIRLRFGCLGLLFLLFFFVAAVFARLNVFIFVAFFVILLEKLLDGIDASHSERQFGLLKG